MKLKLNRPLVAIGIVSLLYLVVAAVNLVEWPAEVGHIATTIVAVLIVHILDHTYFRAEIRTEFENMSAKIVADVRLQTKQELNTLNTSVKDSVDQSRLALEQSLNALLADQSESVAAMQKNSIRRMYSSRAAAASRIAETLVAPTRMIRLMGVSLNDFFRGDNPQLRDAWVRLNNAIQASEEGDVEQEIRVLMVNPRSFGAVLRSYAESSHTGPMFVGRLKSDVEATLDNLLSLEELSRNKKVRLLCRLYNIAPTMFISHVDECCFVQHYHFWTQRRDSTPMAVIEYGERPAAKNAFPMHSEIKAHFDVIWENAAISICAYWGQHSAGIDESAGQSVLVNIYNIKDEGRRRITAVLRAFREGKEPFHEEQKTQGISVQGISLKSFFSSGSISDRMYEIIQSGQANVRILFLDPEGEQARFRSYREYLLQRQIEYSTYTEDLQRESTLSRDTREAIDQLTAWIENFSKDPTWRCRVKAKKYRSAPMSFVLQVGDRLLIEPYNYGKLGGQSGAPATLGTDMPLFEFQREVPAMFHDVEYRRNNLVLRNPFQLVMDHFDFAFRTGIEIPLVADNSRSEGATS